MKTILWLTFGCLATLLWGCAPAISPTMQQESDPRVTFAKLAANPDLYKGQTKILGGEVMQLQPLGQGSLLSLDQHDLDNHLFPSAPASGGTFLVESDEWLNPSTYQPKSKVTVVGEVLGRKNGWLLLKAKQIRFWEGPRWEKWYYPVPREWYNYDPSLEYWFTPPYWDPWRGGGRR